MSDSNSAITRRMWLRRVAAFTLATVLPPAMAEQVPDLVFTGESGEPLPLSAFRGKLVYLDFWASWCAPCRQSFPWMQAMQERYGERGLVVLAVNVDREREEARQFLAGSPARFRVAYDPEGKTARTLKLKGMPSSYLIGRDGSILSSHIGFRETDRLPRENEIRNHLER